MVIGQYKVIREIGSGSFARTFYAEHLLLNEPVCIKQDKTGNQTIIRMLRNEAKLLWNIHHISLPSMKDYIETKKFGALIIMSYVPGENIENILKNNRYIDDEHITWIMQRLLDALSYLHYYGIIHCDIKPQNIILNTKEHNATLVDFGLYTKNPTRTSKAQGGTNYFIPPEFEFGLPPIPASDIYSLGKTLLLMAGGNPQTGTIPKDIHPGLGKIISNMTRQDSMARPQNAQTLNNEVTKFRISAYGRTSTREEFKYRNQRRAS